MSDESTTLGEMPEYVVLEVQGARNRVAPYEHEAPMIIQGKEQYFRRYDRSVVYLADALDARDREIAGLHASELSDANTIRVLSERMDRVDDANADLRTQLAQAERERDAMRPVVTEAQRWYHSVGGEDDHALGREVPRYENLTSE